MKEGIMKQIINIKDYMNEKVIYKPNTVEAL